MKLLELEIRNVRGIRELTLKPNGENFLVWGPNGTGKSAVIDAIDFLLTGKVTRLTGQGTAGLTLALHGPHLGTQPKDAFVRAIVTLPGKTEPVEVKRCMANPSKLLADKTALSRLQPILELAARGQHILTRREILRYITAEAGSRAAQIQSLLNITEVDTTRKALVSVRTTAERTLDVSRSQLEKARGSVNATSQVQVFDRESILAVVNRYRILLGGSQMTELSGVALKTDLVAPRVASTDGSNVVSLFGKDLANLRSIACTSQEAVLLNHQRLSEALHSLVADHATQQAVDAVQLLDLGIRLLDGSGRCPLCGIQWLPGTLEAHLNQRHELASAASSYMRAINESASIIRGIVNTSIASLDKVLAVTVAIADLGEVYQSLLAWKKSLAIYLEALGAPKERYLDSQFELSQLERLMAPYDLIEMLDSAETIVNRVYPRSTPEQEAWDMLTRLEESLKNLDSAEIEHARAEKYYRMAARLVDEFEMARDQVLRELYDGIKDRFVYLYRQLHKEDEGQFSAILRPDGPRLNLEVDFYGRGAFPPHALHSEGHQDSMGLCLYLALCEYLTDQKIDLVLLDDVVMSVDAEHRRQLCHVLATEFPGRQFVITTHDQTWASQLRSEGVVSSGCSIQFYGWHLETGPKWYESLDVWQAINEDINADNIPSAAARLRRGLEQLFAEICDALQAQVRYRRDGRYELGDLQQGAIGQYRKLLKQAKKAAQSWGQTEKEEELEALDSIVAQILRRTNAEQWAINAGVHYNQWANFSRGDFAPVVEAFEDLHHNAFLCRDCGSLIRLTTQGSAPAKVSCRCGKISWNLLARENK